MTPDVKWHIRDFAERILHGTDEHRDWLLKAAEDYINDWIIEWEKTSA